MAAAPAPPPSLRSLLFLLPSRVPAMPRRWTPLLLLLLLLTALRAATPHAAASPPSYADHCGAVVPESSPADGSALDSHPSFHLDSGYLSGGDRLFGRDGEDSLSIPRSLTFRPWQLYRTRAPGHVGVKGSLALRGGSIFVVRGNHTRGRGLFRVVHPRGPGALLRRGRVGFHLSGFWSEATGKLCMVGTGFAHSREGKALDLSAVFELNYPKITNITFSLVTGSVKSLDSAESPNFFDPISLLAYSQNTYEYTLIPDAKKMSGVVVARERALPLGGGNGLCSILGRFVDVLGLFYGDGCQSRNCSPFGATGGFLPSFMSLRGLQCSEDGRLRMCLVFSDSNSFSQRTLMHPEKMLLGEGFWDHERNHLSIVACRVLNFTNSLGSAYAGNCTIGLRLWFPEVLSIKNRSRLVGHIWSNRSSTDPGYFEMITVGGLQSLYHPISGLKYEYTKVDLARKSCVKKDVGNSQGKQYPDGKSLADLRFDLYLSNSAGKSIWAFANPISIGDTFYSDIPMLNYSSLPSVAAVVSLETNQSLWNISYKISTGFYNGSLDMSHTNQIKDISAEGIYNRDTGTLCLIGCRDIGYSNGEKLLRKMNDMDCKILINVQLSPVNPAAGEHLSGTMRSMRNESDPLYFKTLAISSYIMYKKQAAEWIWRMDVEITMVLISLTFSCVFIGLQLFHVKKHPDVLPSTSITMLVVLTLGHMIPLVLNFEALFFMNRNKQNVLLWSGGWLEVNEVIVRLITMVAFLLQFWFLQLAWSSRSAEGTKQGSWVAERKALQFCLPLYFIGLLIAWFVHSRSYEAQMPRPGHIAEPQVSLWEDLISYAGLLLDGFLLPQILLNVFWKSKDKVLVPAFYGGTTIVRALPHIYDAYRARHYIPHINSSYIYASPEGDLYSSAWDIIIPCEGILFAIIIYLQQRFGGSCILPPKFRNPGGYETVPTVSG